MAEHQELIVANGFLLMDREDENQIIREIQGEVIKDFVYSFRGSDGHQVTGLSKVGVDNVCREAAKQGELFRVIGDPLVSDEGDYLRVVVKVGRFTYRDGQQVEMDSTLGAKRQWKKIRRRDGSTIPDPFFFEKALSKAERNAKRKLLPESLITKMIEEYRKKGKVKEIKAEAVETKAKVEPTFADRLAKAKAMLGAEKYAEIVKPWGDLENMPPELQGEVLTALRQAVKEMRGKMEKEEHKEIPLRRYTFEFLATKLSGKEFTRQEAADLLRAEGDKFDWLDPDGNIYDHRGSAVDDLCHRGYFAPVQGKRGKYFVASTPKKPLELE